jgi:hypothetical protein
MGKIAKRLLFYSRRLIDCYSLRQQIKTISYRGNKTGCIVFNTIGCAVADVDAEHYLAYLLALEGYEVKLLMDDFQMPHWEYILKIKSSSDYKFHRSLKNRFLRGGYGLLSQLIFKHPRVEIIPYSKILKTYPGKFQLTEKEQNHAASSVRKYFQSGETDLNNPEHQNYYEESLKNVEISKKAAKYIDEIIKPDLFFTSHGFYSAWGAAKDYLEGKGYPVIIYYPCGYREQHVLMFENTGYSLTKDLSWVRFREKRLKKLQVDQVDDFFSRRLQGTSQDNNLYYQGFSDHKSLAVNKGSAHLTLGLFPNIIWDGDIIERNTIFKSPVEWIVSTISFIEQNPNLHLVLRFHPAEATYYTTSRKLESIITEHVPHLSSIKNITVISSDQKIKTYDLLRDHIDVALVYDGMVGFEAPYIGKPVILAAKGKLLGAGVGFEPESKKDYFELLADSAKCVRLFSEGPYRENLYKFASWFFFEQCFRVALFDEIKYAYIQYTPKSRSLDPTYDSELRRLIGYFNSRMEKNQREFIADTITHVEASV